MKSLLILTIRPYKHSNFYAQKYQDIVELVLIKNSRLLYCEMSKQNTISHAVTHTCKIIKFFLF